MKRKVVAVCDVNRYVSRLFEEDYVLSDVWISGEVSNCKYHHTGHIYFTLKDAKASINMVMFARDAEKLDFRLEEGTNIYARSRMSLYEKTGAYQGYVFEIEKQGMGTLYEQFEKLKKKLSDDGLFDPSHKQRLPAYPTKVGVITSHTGAAIKDILQVANRRNASIPIYIYPTLVQGINAKNEIAQAIAKANEDNIVDVLIVGRGGGSIEDLWAFNEVCVAQAIFNSHIPIVSAVGHEVDFTIADFVSDQRAATPSAAAELVFPSLEDNLARIKRYEENLAYCISASMTTQKNRLQAVLSRPMYTNKHKYFQDKMILLDSHMTSMNKSYHNTMHTAQNKLLARINTLESLSPLQTLKRGYSLVTKEAEDTLIRSSSEVAINDRLTITLGEGFVVAKVEEKG